MSQGTVLHVFSWDKKFFEPFRSFIHKHFADGRHNFIVHGVVTPSDVPYSSDTTIVANLLKNFIRFSVELHKADKVVLHCLFSHHLLYILAVQPWLLKKCYWVIWGGDLYVHLRPKKRWRNYKDEFFRKTVIKKMGHLVTYIEGDYRLAKQWYGATGQHHECLMYTSNLYIEYNEKDKQQKTINILVGNSADPSNNHTEAFKSLEQFKEHDIKIIVPLSYGDQEYARKVISEGVEYFGDKFKPLVEFMDFEKYLDLLAGIDIAIFNHNRQQAMGNTITLLGLGKKVYMRSNVTQWDFFESHKIKVFDIIDVNLQAMDIDEKKQNQIKVKEYFSLSTYKHQLQELFD